MFPCPWRKRVNVCASAPSVRSEGPAGPLVWSPEAKRSARDQCGRLGGNRPMNISRNIANPPPTVLLNQFRNQGSAGVRAPPWPCLPLDIGKAFKEGGEAVWGASPIPAAQPVGSVHQDLSWADSQPMTSRFLWNSCKIPMKSSFFVIFRLAPTFVACASHLQIEALFLDLRRF